MTTTILKGFTFRLYPNKKQEIRIAKTIGCGRFVYNHFLLYGMKRMKKQAKDCHTQSAPLCVRCSKPLHLG